MSDPLGGPLHSGNPNSAFNIMLIILSCGIVGLIGFVKYQEHNNKIKQFPTTQTKNVYVFLPKRELTKP